MKTGQQERERVSMQLSESEYENRRDALLFKAFSDPTRLKIIKILARKQDYLSVNGLLELFTCSQPTLSHHLMILRTSGIVDFKKDGLEAYYYVKPDELVNAVRILQNVLRGL